MNIEVTTEFPPEAFHMGIYQNLGSVRGSKGNTTTLFRVKPADVKLAVAEILDRAHRPCAQIPKGDRQAAFGSRSRSCGVERSISGPSGTIPVGFTCFWPP